MRMQVNGGMGALTRGLAMIDAYRGLGDTCTQYDASGEACIAWSSDTGSSPSPTTPPDGGTPIPGCTGYNTGSDCVACGPGYLVNSSGGCDPVISASGGSGGADINGITQAQCSNAGRSWVNNTCYLNSPSGPVPPTAASGAAAPPTLGSFAAFLASIGNMFKGTAAPTSAAACAAAKGAWNGASCVMPASSGSLQIGGMTISVTTLLIIGGVLLVLSKGKR